MRIKSAIAWALGLSVGISVPAVAVDSAAVLADKPPRHLSAYRLFEDGAAQVPAEGVVPYDLVTPLFSDYAEKFRFVHVPDGMQARYRRIGVFDFPVGTVLVKTFAYPADRRAPDRDIRLLETRLLIHKESGWVAYPYVWDAAIGDAVLKLAGARLNVSWVHDDGSTKTIRYVVPNVNQCKGCHNAGGRLAPIGPKARNLNRIYDYSGGPANQLDHWHAQGMLAGAPDPQTAPRITDWTDMSAPIEARARAYLDVNCAHCHSPAGPADTSGLYLEWEAVDRTALGIMKRPVAAGRGSGGLSFDIVPGDPDASILIFRMESEDPGIMMPELGRALPHKEGIALVRAWITTMK